VVLPLGAWPTLLDFLAERFAHIGREEWLMRMQNGDVLDDQGTALNAQAGYTTLQTIHYFRALHQETPIPFQETVLFQNEHLVVVDKPHFLPVMPSGKYLQETVLVRLKKKLGLNDLVPIHRIDRDTAGLVLFSSNPETRDAYHALFRDRAIDKTYEAIAPWNPALDWPQTRESRIEVSAHFMQQAEVPGIPNALTHIKPIEILGTWARYQLQPVSGQRHQLRVHMAALGLPLLWDGMYPTLTPEGSSDFSKPLQLLAKSIAFTDPVSKKAMAFESQQRLMRLADLA
jgi:tRNA pseudouridine32 synthase/23S rRNA pseudouridine746 synthase